MRDLGGLWLRTLPEATGDEEVPKRVVREDEPCALLEPTHQNKEAVVR